MTEPAGTRPDSLARNFSSQVKSAFNLDGQLPSLATQVEEQKHTILKERQELHRLEAQLEETEEAIAQKLSSTEQEASQTSQIK